MKRTGLLTIGGAYLDINAPNFPLSEDGLHLETETVGHEYQFELGGSAVNIARLSSALGLPASFVGKVGEDELGSILSNLLENAQVEPLLTISKNVSTNVSFNMISQSGKSIMAVVGTANQSLTAGEVYTQVSKRLPTSAYLFLGGCFKLKKLMPAFIKLTSDAKRAGVKVVLDHSRLNDSATEKDKQMVRELALKADVYLPSANEFKQLWGFSSLEEGLRLLRNKMSGIIVIKNGTEGVLTTIDDKIVTVPAFPVEPLHTVGAGDSFNAGFIASQAQGEAVLASMKVGCATAALKISQKSLPTYKEVIRFFQHYR